MKWYWIVLLTTAAVHAINFIASGLIADERHAIYFSSFLITLPFWVLTTPIRRHNDYNRRREHYQKIGITYWQYMFGKKQKDGDNE